MEETIRVLVADDHLIVREGLRLILETESGFHLIGEAADGAEAIRLSGELHPDVVLMDLRMPGMDGLTAIEHLQVEKPDVAVVILTTFNEDDLMLRGLRAGARGYLLKDASRETLFAAIRAAAHGETLLSPASSAASELTEREQEVLQAIARGERSKEIAFHLGISERTVKAHLSSIYSKLGVDSRAAAIAVAAQHGLLSDALDPDRFNDTIE
jgi:NarL family two-component system response regulator YdfI